MNKTQKECKIRDLAFAGKNALEKINVKPPKRDEHIVSFGTPRAGHLTLMQKL
jgi:hypothetical protein